jgi:hypothetical protein
LLYEPASQNGRSGQIDVGSLTATVI